MSKAEESYKKWQQQTVETRDLYFESGAALVKSMENIFSYKLNERMHEMFTDACFEIEKAAFCDGFNYALNLPPDETATDNTDHYKEEIKSMVDGITTPDTLRYLWILTKDVSENGTLTAVRKTENHKNHIHQMIDGITDKDILKYLDSFIREKVKTK